MDQLTYIVIKLTVPCKSVHPRKFKKEKNQFNAQNRIKINNTRARN